MCMAGGCPCAWREARCHVARVPLAGSEAVPLRRPEAGTHTNPHARARTYILTRTLAHTYTHTRTHTRTLTRTHAGPAVPAVPQARGRRRWLSFSPLHMLRCFYSDPFVPFWFHPAHPFCFVRFVLVNFPAGLARRCSDRHPPDGRDTAQGRRRARSRKHQPQVTATAQPAV